LFIKYIGALIGLITIGLLFINASKGVGGMKKRRVCKDCGYINVNFFEKQRTTGGPGCEWKITEYRCPECGSDNIKTRDEVLNEIIKGVFGK
jgi:Zn finger protein HypA/HybF involved in hydrogenase expression